jgi:hypothetical protein
VQVIHGFISEIPRLIKCQRTSGYRDELGYQGYEKHHTLPYLMTDYDLIHGGQNAQTKRMGNLANEERAKLEQLCRASTAPHRLLE